MTRSISELTFRKSIAEYCLSVLGERGQNEQTDAAIDNYTKQRDLIQAELDEAIKAEPPKDNPTPDGKPPPIVIGLKTATLFGKAEKLGG